MHIEGLLHKSFPMNIISYKKTENIIFKKVILLVYFSFLLLQLVIKYLYKLHLIARIRDRKRSFYWFIFDDLFAQ